MSPRGSGRGFSGVFVFRQAKVSHRAIIARKRHTVAFEFRVLELAPHVELIFDTGLALLFGTEPRRRQPVVRRRGLGSRPEGP